MQLINWQRVKYFIDSLDTPGWKAIKEIVRWLVFFVLSWIVTEMMKQIDLVPESSSIRVWVFTLTVPIRAAFAFVLTFVGRFADKYVFERSKEETRLNEQPKGILPF